MMAGGAGGANEGVRGFGGRVVSQNSSKDASSFTRVRPIGPHHSCVDTKTSHLWTMGRGVHLVVRLYSATGLQSLVKTD